jgi:hypothetical protein
MDVGRADGTGIILNFLPRIEHRKWAIGCPGLKPQGTEVGRADGTGILLNLNAVGMVNLITREFIHGQLRKIIFEIQFPALKARTPPFPKVIFHAQARWLYHPFPYGSS